MRRGEPIRYRGPRGDERQVVRLWATAPGHKKCTNTLCLRQIRESVKYCCYACELAHQGSYEIHETGPLSHSVACDDQADRRGPAKELR
jgi:hypothetical protein